MQAQACQLGRSQLTDSLTDVVVGVHVVGGEELGGEGGLAHAGRAQHGHLVALGRRPRRHLHRRPHQPLPAPASRQHGRAPRGGRHRPGIMQVLL